MVSTTESAGRGGGTRNGPAAIKKQPKPSNKKSTGFKGDAKSESALYLKVITSGSSQSAQLLALTASLSTYIGEKGYSHWADSIRLGERKEQADFMPPPVRRSSYGSMNTANPPVFQWDGNALDTEDQYNIDMQVWNKSVSAAINQWNSYVNNGEALMLAIKGQIDTSLWDKLVTDSRFLAVQTDKCPIGLLNLMSVRSTGGNAGVWEPIACLRQLKKTIGYSQSPPRGGGAPLQNGEFKRATESHVATSMKLGGILAFGAALMEPILAAANTQLLHCQHMWQ